MADNVIKAVFASGRRVKTAPLWRYDHGIRLQPIGLELPGNYEMHFSNSETGEAKAVLADATGAVIPAEYLLPGTEVYAWVYLVGDTYGRTKAEIIIPVDPKAQPTDQEPTPEQQPVIEQAIDALNDAVDAIPEEINAALEKAKASGEFDGEDGADGNSIWYTIKPVIMNDDQIMTVRRFLEGREGTPAAGDLVIGSEQGESGAPTYLYRITGDYGPYSVLEAVGSIKGDTGATGADGAPGPQGPAGRDGQDGAQGPAGADGKDGADGAQGPAGADGADGSIIWWTTNRIGSADDSIFINREYLNGPVEPTKDTVKIGDLIVGPEAGSYDLTLTTLYSISSFASKMCILTELCRLKGDKGDTGATGAVDSVNGQTGVVVLTASDVGAVAVAQGASHAGEFLVVGSDGNVTTVSMTAWQGGSY